MAFDTNSWLSNAVVTSIVSPTCRQILLKSKLYSPKTKNIAKVGKILKPKEKSLVRSIKSAHLQQLERLCNRGPFQERGFSFPDYCTSDLNMQDTEMNDVLGSVCFERSETQVPNLRVGSQFNSPVDDGGSRCSKSPSSIEDLNKEIERLFLNNEQFGFTSFIWDKEEVAEGRRAPIADMLHCYKGYNRRKKRRSATVLGIRNYNESDSSNGISSPDDNSGCEEYSQMKLIEHLDPPIIVPVPVGKSEIDQLNAVSYSGPFSSNKLKLSEDSAFAPVKSTITRCQTLSPENIIYESNNENQVS